MPVLKCVVFVITFANLNHKQGVISFAPQVSSAGWAHLWLRFATQNADTREHDMLVVKNNPMVPFTFFKTPSFSVINPREEMNKEANTGELTPQRK